MDKEALDNSIEKAIANGWQGILLDITTTQQDDGTVRVYWDNTEWSVLDIIYNKSFAKALWGERETGPIRNNNTGGRVDAGGYSMFEQVYKQGWMYHLQHMVVSDDYFKYLRDHMDE